MSQPRQLFARTPRGATTNKTPKTGQVLINRSFLDQFEKARLDPGLGNVLTTTSSALSLTVGTGGATSVTLVDRENKVVADHADIQKMMNIDGFINSERKAAQKSSTNAALEARLAAMVETAGTVEAPITKANQGFVDIFRTVSGQMKVVDANCTAIMAAPVNGEDDELVRDHLIRSAARIRKAAADFLVAKLKDHEGSGKLSDFLKRENVLAWTFSKLTAQKVVGGGAGFSLASLAFPKDPTKGLQVTFAEISSESMRNAQHGILKGCRYMATVVDHPQLVNALIGRPIDESFEGDDPVTRKLQNTPFLVPRPSVDPVELASQVAKAGLKGFSWGSGASVTPADQMRVLGTAFRRLLFLGLPRPQYKKTAFSRLFPDIGDDVEASRVFDRLKEISSTDGGAVQIGNFYSALSDAVANKGYRLYFAAGLLEILGVPQNSVPGTMVSDLFLLSDGATAQEQEAWMPTPIRDGASAVPHDTWSEIMSKSSTLKDRAKNREALKRVFDRLPGEGKKKKPKEQGSRNVRSGLAPTAKAVLRKLKDRNYLALNERLDLWFRSFLTQTIQAAVAAQLDAKLDWHLSRPIGADREDLTLLFGAAAYGQGVDHVEGDPNDSSEEEEEEDDALEGDGDADA